MIKGILSSAVVFGVISAVHAGPVVIDFEQDPIGPVANGYFSVDSPFVSFSDSSGSDLLIDDFGVQSIGRGLAVGTDVDGSFLLMNFTTIATSLSLDFGNDDPAMSIPKDFIALTVFLGGIEVGYTEVEMNRDDIMNQSISIDNVFFDSAKVEYYVSGEGLTEVVDNITFNVIPAPGMAAAMIFAAAIVRSRRRRSEQMT